MAKGAGTTRTSTSRAPKGVAGGGASVGSNSAKAIPMNQVSVTGEDYYRFANGVKPKGRGSWAFEIGDKTEFIYGSYSDAKKEAIKRAASLGISRVKLGS